MSTTTARSTDGTAIAYETHGDGPGVILIDGAMCFRDAGPLRPLCAQLRDDFSVLLYDRRGRGQSPDASGAAASFDRDAAVRREVDDLAQLTDAVDEAAGSCGGAPALVGMSSGGALALRAAAMLGGRIRCVVVYEPPYMPDAFTQAAADYTSALAQALASGDRDQAVNLFLKRVGTPDETVADMRRSPAWPGMTAIAPSLAYDDAAMGDSRVPVDVLAMIEVPVLALAGGGSPEFLQYGARMVAEHVGDGTFDVLAEQGHDVDAGVFASRVRDFLRR